MIAAIALMMAQVGGSIAACDTATTQCLPAWAFDTSGYSDPIPSPLPAPTEPFDWYEFDSLDHGKTTLRIVMHEDGSIESSEPEAQARVDLPALMIAEELRAGRRQFCIPSHAWARLSDVAQRSLSMGYDMAMTTPGMWCSPSPDRRP